MLNLKQRRIELGLTMLEVAKAVGVSEATISRYESGNIKNMRRDRIEKYAAILKINPAAFIEQGECKLQLDTTPFKPQRMIPIPVVGSVAAGYACLAETDIESYELVDSEIILDGYEYVWLRVKGDSMEPMLLESDLVLVRLQNDVENGDYAVVIVDSEDGLVKRIEKNGDSLTLVSNNPYYPPRMFSGEEMNRVHIFGKVIESKRKF